MTGYSSVNFLFARWVDRHFTLNDLCQSEVSTAAVLRALSAAQCASASARHREHRFLSLHQLPSTASRDYIEL